MNPRLCSLVFNDFIKHAIFQQLIECALSMMERRKLKSGPCDLPASLKPGIYQPELEKEINPRLWSLVFNGFIKPAIFEQLIECLVSKGKKGS